MMKRPPPYQRCYLLEYLGTNTAKFECKPLVVANGQVHTFIGPVIPRPKGFRGPFHPAPEMIHKMVRYWSKANGGVTTHCPQCLKLYNEQWKRGK